MTNCPSEDCKTKLDDVREYVYGKGPGTGLYDLCVLEVKSLKTCLAEFKKSWSQRTIIIVCAFAIVGIGTGYAMYHSTQSNADRIAENLIARDKMELRMVENERLGNMNNINVAIVQRDIAEIKASLKEIKASLQKLNGNNY